MVSSVRARSANSPVLSKSTEVYEAGDLNCFEGLKVWMMSCTLVMGARCAPDPVSMAWWWWWWWYVGFIHLASGM
jgi:hypothetical protein